MKISKTTLLGSGGILGGLIAILTQASQAPLVAGQQPNYAVYAAALAVILTGIGHLFARDNTTSDEAAGVTPTQLAVKQAASDQAALAAVPPALPQPTPALSAQPTPAPAPKA